MQSGRRSLVRIAAIPYSMDGDGVGGLVEHDAVVADAQPEQALILTGEPLDSSAARFGVIVQGLENAKCGLLRYSSDLERHVWRESDFLHAVLSRLGCRGSDPW
jgi:hypothetical protein